MNRNDLIVGLIRVIGVYILVVALIEVPNFIISVAVNTFDSIRVAFNATFGSGMDRFGLANVMSATITLILRIVLGYYLMNGGKWFVSKATRE